MAWLAVLSCPAPGCCAGCAGRGPGSPVGGGLWDGSAVNAQVRGPGGFPGEGRTAGELSECSRALAGCAGRLRWLVALVGGVGSGSPWRRRQGGAGAEGSGEVLSIPGTRAPRGPQCGSRKWLCPAEPLCLGLWVLVLWLRSGLHSSPETDAGGGVAHRIHNKPHGGEPTKPSQ